MQNEEVPIPNSRFPLPHSTRRNPHSAIFAASAAIIAAAGVEQGVAQGTLSRMLDGLRVGDAAGGLLVMAFAAGIVLGSFGAAVTIGRLGTRGVMFYGAACAAAAWIGHGLGRDYGAGLALFFLAGCGHGAMLAGASAAASQSAGGPGAAESLSDLTKRRGRRISLVQAFYMMGLSAGALAGGYAGALGRALRRGPMSESDGWATAYFASAAVSIAAACFLLATVRRAEVPERGPAPRLRIGVLREVAALPGAALVLTILFLDICAEAGVGAWLSRHLQVTWNATAPLAGWAVSLSYAGIAGGRLLLGFWSPRMEPARALLAAAACCAALTFLLALTPPPASLAVAGLAGLAIALVVPYGLALVRGRCPDALADAATSTALGVACLGSLALPPIMGAVAQWGGSFRVAMLLPPGLYVVIVLLSARLARYGTDGTYGTYDRRAV